MLPVCTPRSHARARPVANGALPARVMCPPMDRASPDPARMVAAQSSPESLVLPAASRAQGSVRLPGSKSISNRTLLLAALARGDTTMHGLLDADDVVRMREALLALGVRVEERGDACTVAGANGTFSVERADL